MLAAYPEGPDARRVGGALGKAGGRRLGEVAAGTASLRLLRPST
jgi:hypothetical protein